MYVARNKYKHRTILAWGDNNYGQLTYTTSANHSTLPVPLSIPKLSDNEFIVNIAAGITHAIILTNNQRIFTWGTITNSLKKVLNPQLISLPLLDVGEYPVTLGAGYMFSVILTNFGRVITWGTNEFGQLGHTSNSIDFVPLEGVIEIAVGWHHVLARTANKLYAWGRGTEGQLGNSSNNHSSAPVIVDTIERTIAIAAGCNFSAFISEEWGHVFTWGNNNEGQLAVGYTGGCCYYPQVTLGHHIEERMTYIACGASHLLLATHNTCYCYGSNKYGQLNLPTKVIVLDILAGTNYSVIVGLEPGRIETSLFIAGSNEHGLLGKADRHCSYNILRQSKNVIMLAGGGSTMYMIVQ